MNTKKTTRKNTLASTDARTESSGSNGQPGYLGKLKMLHRDHHLPIRVLNSCQVRRKNADPATVAKYVELLTESEPPAIIVILDDHGRHFIGDGHNRTAAALATGRSTIKADVYAGTHADAKLIGLEANQHGLALSLAERKAALDDILDNNGYGFTDSALARLVGLDRHTIERRRQERESGDFIGAACKMRPLKTPEEAMVQAASVFARQVEKYGQDLVLKMLEVLPAHLKEDIMRQLLSSNGTQHMERG